MISPILITVDPGTKAIGVARFDCGWLAKVAVTRGASVLEHRRHLDGFMEELLPNAAGFQPRLLIEKMTNRGAQDPTPPQTLIDLSAFSAAVVGGLTGNIGWIPVHDWKNSLPKTVHHKRIRKRLEARELAVLSEGLQGVPGSYHKEALDAVGIGLKTLGRIDKAGRRLQG